mgnify:CR=1 FL=1
MWLSHLERSFPLKALFTISIASSPLNLTIDIAPFPNAVDIENPIIYIYNSHQLENYSSTNYEAYNITPNVMMASYILKEMLFCTFLFSYEIIITIWLITKINLS